MHRPVVVRGERPVLAPPVERVQEPLEGRCTDAHGGHRHRKEPLSSRVGSHLEAGVTAVRNATLLLELGGLVLLVDPMLNAAGQVPPVESTAPTLNNPLVELPIPPEEVVAGTDFVLVTHLHNDHFDDAARRLLPKDIPVLCQPTDADRLAADGFTALRPVEDACDLGDAVRVHRLPARHSLDGEHEVALGPCSGYVVAGSGIAVHVAGDCVWCPELAAALDAFRPDVVVVNGGAARFLTGAPISMTSDDIIATARHAAWARIVAVHLEALNHCPMTRDELRRHTVAAGVDSRVLIPADGERLALGPG